MTRSEAIKAFFFKSVLPVTVALILYCVFKSACVKNGEIDYTAACRSHPGRTPIPAAISCFGS